MNSSLRKYCHHFLHTYKNSQTDACRFGRPIMSGCDGPKERIFAFVHRFIQPIAQKQDSYLKDTTDFLNFLERTNLPKNTVLVSMDVTSLYTNIPHEEGVTTVCHAYEDFYGDKAPIPTKYLREMLYLILTENSFQFCGSNYLQTHGTTMGTKMAVAFANIFMARIERQILCQSCIKPLFWKRYMTVYWRRVFAMEHKSRKQRVLWKRQITFTLR